MRTSQAPKIIVGLVLAVAGLSGQFVLRGSDSSAALVVVGFGLVAWGLVQPTIDERVAQNRQAKDREAANLNAEERIARGPVEHVHYVPRRSSTSADPDRLVVPPPVGQESLRTHLSYEHGMATQVDGAVAFLSAEGRLGTLTAPLSAMHLQAHPQAALAKDTSYAATPTWKRAIMVAGIVFAFPLYVIPGVLGLLFYVNWRKGKWKRPDLLMAYGFVMSVLVVLYAIALIVALIAKELA